MNTAPQAITKTIGVVLAGGQSRRMGQDKATLQLAGNSLLQLARRALLAAGCGEVVLSGPPRPDWPDMAIPDLHPGCGPVGGIVSVINALANNDENGQADTTHLLICAVDTPKLTPPLLQALLEHLPQHNAACYTGQPLPLALKLDATLHDHAQSVAAQLTMDNALSVLAFLAPLDCLRLAVPGDQTAAFTNLNTPQDWANITGHTS